MPPADARLTAWRRHGTALLFAWAAIITLLYRDALHLVTIWWTSSTFTHCLLLVPIIGWLVWIRKDELAKLTPAGWWPGLLWMATGAGIWMLGEAGGVALFRQAGLVIAMLACVPTLLGPQMTRGLVFPIFYALFLIPFGEELVPPMQMVTAELAMAMLRLTGIPAHIDGIFITTPAGLFAVAEACSGVKFLVAMAALAVLVAHLGFRSWRRRVIFLAVAMIIPVLANGVRAFSTIWIAERWGVGFAASADHIIYGWVFFAAVMALIGWIFWPWFDRAADEVPIDGAQLAARPFRSATLGVALATALGLALIPRLWLTQPLEGQDNIAPMAAGWPAGWTEQAPELPVWRPQFAGADALNCVSLAPPAAMAAETSPVTICLAQYRYQAQGRELVGYGQGAVDPASDWRWMGDGEAIGPMRVLRIGTGMAQRDVAILYRIGGALTASEVDAKWLTLRARLLRQDQRAEALLLSAATRGGSGGRVAIEQLVSDAGGAAVLFDRLTPQR